MSGTHCLPSSWAAARLHGVAEVNPSRIDPPSPSDSLFNFVPMSAVAEEFGGIDVCPLRPYLEVRKGYTQFQSGDVLFAKITPCMENGKIAVVPELTNVCGYGSTEFHVLRPYTDMAAKWIAYYVLQTTFRREAQRNMSGSAGQLRVSKDWLKEQRLPVAPAAEQRRIVAKIEKFFSGLDAGVAALERAKANLKRYRATVLKAAVEGKLTEQWRKENPPSEPASELLERILAERKTNWDIAQDEKLRTSGGKGKKGKYYEPNIVFQRDLPEIPEAWVWSTLDPITYFTIDYRGKTPPPAVSGVPIISAANVKAGRIVMDKPRYVSLETYRSWIVRGLPKPGDLVLTTEAPVAEAGLYPDDQIYLLTRRVLACQTFGVDNRYVMYAMQGQAARDHIHQHLRGTTVPRILKPDLLATPVPLPPVEEQAVIADAVAEQLSVIEATAVQIEADIARSKRLRQSILKRAFKGKLVEQDPSEEPASVLLERIQSEQKKERTNKPHAKAGRRKHREVPRFL